MSLHRIARNDLDVALRALVRGGEHIDHIDLDVLAGEYVVITEDRIEVRPMTELIAARRLGIPTDGAA